MSLDVYAGNSNAVLEAFFNAFFKRVRGKGTLTRLGLRQQVEYTLYETCLLCVIILTVQDRAPYTRNVHAEQ